MIDAASLPDLTRSFRVLIVEDEFMIAMDIQMMLAESGHEVVGKASSVEEALQLLEDLRPDIAILDGNLNGSSVMPVALRLKELSVPFVLASAYEFDTGDSNDPLSEASNVGKPFSDEQLLGILHKILANK